MSNSNAQETIRKLREKYGAGSDAAQGASAKPVASSSMTAGQKVSALRDKYGAGSDAGRSTAPTRFGPTAKTERIFPSEEKQAGTFKPVAVGTGRENESFTSGNVRGGGRWTAQRVAERHGELSDALEQARADALSATERTEAAKAAHRQILDARAHNTSTAEWEADLLRETGFASFEELKRYVDNPSSTESLQQKVDTLEKGATDFAGTYYHVAGQEADDTLSSGKRANLYRQAVYAAIEAQSLMDRYRNGGWNNEATSEYAAAVQKKVEMVAELEAAGYERSVIDRALEYAVRKSREERTAKSEESLAQYAKENPVAASAISVGTGVAQGTDYVKSLVKSAGHSNPNDLENYKPLSKADMQFTGMTGALRGGVTQRIEEDIDNETLEKAAIFAYQTGMSVADSMSLALTLGPAASVVMGSGAAANATRDAVERGGTNRQALTLGLAAGVAELMFERISIGNLLDDTKLVTNAKQWALETMKQAGVEASEEMATEVANIIADAVIMGRNSNSERARRQYLAQGMTPEQAERQVFLDNLESVGLAGLGGALSGGVSGGSFNAVNLAGEYAAENLLWRGVSQGAQEGQEQGSLKGVWGDGQKNTALFGSSKYTKEEADAIRHEGRTFINVIAGIDSTVSEFFKKWAGGRKSHLGEKLEKLYLGKMTDAVKSEVSDILGYDVDERDFIVTNDDVKHIIDEHGDSQKETGQKNNIPLDEWVFDALPEVVTNPDTIKKGHEGTGKNKGKTGVVFSKTFPNGRVVSVQYDNKGRGTLEIATIYAKESTTSVVNTPDGVNTFTSKTTEPVLSSNQRIAQEANGVNIVPEITSEDAERIKQAKHFGGKSGLVRDANLDKMNLSYRVSSTIDAIAKIAGVQVRVVEKAAGGSANGTYSEGVIELAMDSENPLMTVFTHELVHRIRETSPESYAAMAKFVQENVGGRAMKALANRYSKAYKTTDVSEWSEEMVADAFATVLQDSKVMSQFAQDNRTAFEKVRDVIRDMINAVKRVLNGQNAKMTGEQRAAFSRLAMQLQEMEKVMADAIKNLPTQEEMSVGKSGNRESAADIVKKSLKWDSKFMDAAESANKGRISASVMRSAREARQAVADIFNNPDLADSLGLPPDIIGKTYIPNGSYSGTEENTTECIRTLAADDLMDAVAEHLGRPLTVEDTIAISQEYWKYTDKPECLYCYVAMDRKAHREFLGSYLQQRDDVVKNIESGMSKEEAYQKFLDGRKDTDPMKKRFNMWVNNMGKETISPADLASRASMEKAAAKSASFKAQVNDALKYAQSASWAKKRITYTAYDNHILKWKQNRIDNLNSNYGLRMYSFSDFSPAFILENMQMITDAAVRGLKVLAYTKELDFVRIFAETGMNINISVFGYNDGDGVAMDAMQGADWAEAQALRKKYSNVGCTFVATNDSQVEWALDQDWIDVIIPFHMVRTGTKVASAFGWKNYTAMSADTKAEGWTRENAKHILPPMHQNDKATYLKACKDNNLTPRFEDWVDHPNYMKLVNETRQSEGDTNPVQPVFDLDAAKASIETMRKQGGYYTPIGGSQENMRDIAEEIGKKIEGKKSMKSDSSSWKEAAEAAKQDVKDARLAKMGKEYGWIKRGENPSRDIQVPKRTAKDNKVSQTVRTILEAEATPEEALPTIEKMIADGDFSYEVYGDKQAIKDAEGFVKHRGWGDATREWFDRMKKGEVSKKNTAIGWTLYNNAVNSKDMETAIDILNAMVEHQRNAAQAVQATRILKKMSPEGQLYAAQKSVQRLQEELNERYGKKADVELKIDPALAEELMEAEDQKARDKVLQKIYKDIGRQIPSRFIDKWNAWRYLAMLGNPRTHVRNIVGNAFFAPVVATKNLTATAIESAVNLVTGGKTGRTKAVVGFSTEDKGRLKAAWADYADVAEAAMDGGKYSDSANANKYIQEGRQIFGRTDQAKTKVGRAVSGTVGKGVEAARTFNSKALEAEDRWFSQPHYAAALASYCKANGITAEQMNNGGITDEARAYAIKEAQKATYRDTNTLSDIFGRIGRYEGKKKAGKFVSTVVEGILPFRKTPANILARGLEYSPLGLLKSISYDLVQVKNGDMNATQLIDNLSAGLTGTGLLALGAFLAAQGLVRGAGGDDKDKKEFEDLMGHQNYALEIGGKSYTLDWLAPEALPFFVGVNLWEVGKESSDGRTLADWLTAISNVSEPMMEMSCLQSLNDVFDSVGYASSNGLSGLTSAVASAATSYLTQGIPTLLGQFERSAQDIRMTTYTDKNKKNLTGDMQYAIGSASGKIPGYDYNQIAYIDAWGRTESTGSMLGRILNNMANPSYVSSVDESKMEKELMRLYNSTSDPSVFPNRASKYFSVDGKRIDLNGAQYVSYAKKKGQTAYNLLADLTKNSAYAKLTDTDKAKAVGLVYDYANAVAKAHVSSYKLEGWIRKADNSRDVVSYILKEKVGK
jgi:hypothetical protein